MTLVRWRKAHDPFAELSTLQKQMNRLFEDSAHGWGGGESLTRWAPAVDIYEKDDAIVISAELPGMEEKDIDVEVNEGVLTIRGEKKFDNEIKDDRYHCVERSYGAFERSFSLPATVKHDAVKATYKNGVLEVHLPRSEEAKPRKIDVSVN